MLEIALLNPLLESKERRQEFGNYRVRRSSMIDELHQEDRKSLERPIPVLRSDGITENLRCFYPRINCVLHGCRLTSRVQISILASSPTVPQKRHCTPNALNTAFTGSA